MHAFFRSKFIGLRGQNPNKGPGSSAKSPTKAKEAGKGAKEEIDVKKRRRQTRRINPPHGTGREKSSNQKDANEKVKTRRAKIGMGSTYVHNRQKRGQR
jgi:hypothetical protein